MAMKDLPEWLLANSGFSSRLRALTIASVISQFPKVKSIAETSKFSDGDMSYMLTCSSILAHSNLGKCQDAALRIAQYCLTSDDSSLIKKDGALLVLDALINRAAINLAEKRNLVTSGYEDRLPTSALLESIKRRLSHTIDLNGEKLTSNKFQAEFWSKAKGNKQLSISAPTSVGKSFILESWVLSFLMENLNALVIYIVPTRALITQVEENFRARLRKESQGFINISSLPLMHSYKKDGANIFVFTQERLHIFLGLFEVKPKIDLVIIDEAHKIGDGSRGVFLQQVMEVISTDNPDLRVIFASPFTDNPELLIQDFSSSSSDVIKSSDVTVNQNIIWVSQAPRKPKEWMMSLCFEDDVTPIGKFSLENTPSSVSKRLPFVAVALSQGSHGNIIYVNGAADAEKMANQIYDCLEQNESVDQEILNLIELCEKTIHKKFFLNRVLLRGVAFHYGNMPLLVKSEIERLFSLNKISYLICTSTLVEGVNMSCKNIYVRGPKKGSRSLMTADDFWNLAGRAGRWGREFQGNVICVDANVGRLWRGGHPPRNKSQVHIQKTTDSIIQNPVHLIDYINSDKHFDLSGSHSDLESVFSYLSAVYVEFGSLLLSPYLKGSSGMHLEQLNIVIGSALAKITFPMDLIARNPGISPLLMESLLQRFIRSTDREAVDLLLSDPASEDVIDSYTSAFSRIGGHLNKKLGFTSAQSYMHALLVVRWMRGYSLARLISERVSYLNRKKLSVNLAGVIRDVMREVEEVARYQAPRLLSCYNDLLRFYFATIERPDLQEEIQDVNIYLELGLNQRTQLSLATIGLSRTACVLLSELIASDDMGEGECLAWLKSIEISDLDIPILVKGEVLRLLGKH